MTILESRHINNASWEFFQQKLKELSNQPQWISLLKEVKMKCDLFRLTNKWEDKVKKLISEHVN